MKTYKELFEGNGYDDNRKGFTQKKREDDEYHNEPKAKFKPKSMLDRPHTVHIDGKPWKKFDNGHQANAAVRTLEGKGKKATAVAHFKEEVEEIDESMTDSWKNVQSMDKGSVTGGKDEAKKRLDYLNAVHDHHKKFGNDTKKVKNDIESLNRSRLAEDVEFRLDHRDKVKGDHKSTFKEHEATVSDTTDKATYVKVPAHKADSFKSAMKNKHGVTAELSEARMTAAMKLQKAFQREQEKTASERKAGEELLNKPVKEDFHSKNIAKQELENRKNKGGEKGIVIAALKKKAGLEETLDPSMGAGEYIKDFQKSDAPQFKGKSQEKKRMMGLAAYLQAKDKTVSEGVTQPSGSDKIDTVGNPELNGNAHFVIGKKAPKKTVKEDVVVEGRNEDDVPFDKPYKTVTNKDITDKSGAVHSPMSRARDLARAAMARTAPKSPIKPVKEEVESIDEEAKVETKKYSWGTMKTIHKGASYSIPLHPEHHEHIAKMKDGHVHDIKTEDGRQWHVKREGDTVHFHGANGGPKTSVPHSSLKESVELDEAFVNGREYASHGLMHPDHAKMNLYQKNNNTIDFYHSKTGDKIPGKVVKNDGKEVHIRATSGDVHKYKVTPHLPKQQNESVELDEQAPVAPVPGDKWKSHAVMVNGKQRVVIDRKHTKNYPEHEGWKEVAPGTKLKEEISEDGTRTVEKISLKEFLMLQEYNASAGRYVHKGTYGGAYHDPEGDDDADDKKPVKAPTEKRGRGRPSGSKSGANHKVTTGKSSGFGYDSTGFKLHLPK